MEGTGKAGGTAAAAPTGCFKCGRPGHWSRDCPSSGNPNPSLSSNPKSILPSSSRFPQQLPPGKPPAAVAVTLKKPPRTRPKLTPDILLSEDGLGYVLRHFPRAFKYHGRGHEVADLGNLISLYAQWHSRLIPYYSFDQLIRKVEQVGATARVRRCISELKTRVANGGDISKLHESPTEQVAVEIEQDDPIVGDSIADAVAPSNEFHEADHIEEMADEVFSKATEEPRQPLQEEVHHSTEIPIVTTMNHQQESTKESTPHNQEPGSDVPVPRKILISAEQKARMEANRLKALERAAARARLQAS